MVSYNGLELATLKAEQENAVIFYQEYNSYFGKISYDDFVFYDFISYEDLSKEIYDFCENKSDISENLEFDLQDISNDHIHAYVNGWKNIYVKSFNKDINLQECEDFLLKLFSD